MVLQNPGGAGFLERAYALQGAEEARDLYDEWAASYDNDLESEEYAIPRRAAHALSLLVPEPASLVSLRILDAGCGTGLVGVALANLGAKHIDGVDISPGMLKAAASTDVYANLVEGDLAKPLKQGDAIYDAVTCVGTLTRGHVGPRVLHEFVRVLKKDGWIVATVLDAVWDGGGFHDTVNELVASKQVELLGANPVGVVEGQDTGARMLVLRRL